MEKTKEITAKFLSLNLQTGEKEIVKKILICKELDETTEGEFVFELFNLYKFDEKSKQMRTRPADLYNVTKEYIEKFVDINQEFTKSDRKELFNDAAGLLWLSKKLNEEIFAPFFLKSMVYLEND